MSDRVRWARLLVASFFVLAFAFAIAGCGLSNPVATSPTPTRTVSASASQDTSDSVDTAASDASDGPSPSSVPAARRYVEEVAGVRLGEDDASVTKVLGGGLFTNQEGHSGGRYYVDAARTLTLSVEIGTDSAIDSIELSHGIALPAGLTVQDDPKVTSQALASGASASKGIVLGMSAAEVERRLGKPTSDARTGVQHVITYDDEAGDSNYSAEFTFVGDQLRDMWISDGD